MRKALKGCLVVVVLLLTVTSGAAGYFLLLHNGPPPQRPDLVKLPPDAPEPLRGFPTRNAALLVMGLSYFGGLDLIDILDINYDYPVPEGVVEKKNVEYGKVGDRPLVLDLYYPEKLAAPTTGMIFIHGGGWSMGDKKDYKYYTNLFAERGYVVATIGYRFIKEAKFPGCVEDAKCAVRWMRTNAVDLKVDPEKIIVIGGSAGGHLSMMTGYSSDVPELEGKGGHAGVSSAVAAVVDIYGPYDLTVKMAIESDTVYNFLGKTYQEAPELYEAVSPMKYLDASDPPTLIIHGTVDQIVPIRQSDMLAERLIELGIPYWYDRIDGYPHTMDVTLAVNERVQWMVHAFLEEFVNEGKVVPVSPG